MRTRSVLISVCALVLFLALLGAVLVGSRTKRLVTGKRSVVASRPSGLPWKDRVVTIRREGTNMFGIWETLFERPLFFYSFPDGQKFLCVYNDDITVLVF